MGEIFQDREAVVEAYNDVRNDESPTNWCCLTYEGTTLVLDSCGEDFEELKAKCEDDSRVYAFLRVQTGDEMSKRMKFALIVWAGPGVSVIKKAKLSTDKAFVKQVFIFPDAETWCIVRPYGDPAYAPVINFAKEMMIDDIHEMREDKIITEVQKAGGANYGVGK